MELAEYSPRRVREIFDIIVDYPDSKGALQDLKVGPVQVPLRGVMTDPLLGMFAKG